MSSQASPARKESSEVRQGALEMSTSLPSSSGTFSSANEDSSTRIQVIISPDPNQSHASTPFIDDASTAASLQDENIGVNKKTAPIDLASSKGDLYICALKNNWERAKSIFDEFPHMIPMELTANGDTALHVAARSNSITFVQELVNLKLMTPKTLEITNSDGNTAFCLAAIFGNNGDLFRTMIEKNKNLPQIRGRDEMLPIHSAALNGHRKTVQDLSTEDQLNKMADKDIGRLFLMAISSGLYDVATELLEKYPASLVTAKDDQEQTALHILARKPSQEFYIGDDNKEEASSGLMRDKLFQRLSYYVKRLEYKTAWDLTTKPSKVLFEAVKSGNIHTLKCLLSEIPELLEQKESNGQNILHIAALYRQESIFEFILEMETASHLMWEVDNDRNNVLHLAAQLSSEERSSNLRPIILLAGEWRWFEQMKKKVPRKLGTMRNSKGETPKDTFSADHEELLREAKEAAKGIANPCMLVATLIATVVFPAALTVPGDQKGDERDNSKSPWFIPFFFANAAALFTACASIIFLLTIYTSSRPTEDESFISLNARLYLGLRFLNISVDSMVISLILASWMILQETWARVVVFAMSLPAFVALSYLQYAAVRRALHTPMVRVGKREMRKSTSDIQKGTPPK